MEGGLEDQMGMTSQKTQGNHKLIKITRKGDWEEDPEGPTCNNRNPKEIQKDIALVQR